MEHLDVQSMVAKTENSIYKLVVLASKRALEISEGQPKLIQVTSANLKPSIIALAEISAGKIQVATDKNGG